MEESGDVLRLMSESQSILGRTIGFDMQSTLLMLYDTYGLSVEVIFMLLEFCVHQSRSSTAYVAKLGKVWAEKEINTVELAADYIEKEHRSRKKPFPFCVSLRVCQLRGQLKSRRNTFCRGALSGLKPR